MTENRGGADGNRNDGDEGRHVPRPLHQGGEIHLTTRRIYRGRMHGYIPPASLLKLFLSPIIIRLCLQVSQVSGLGSKG